MEKFTTITSSYIPLPIENVDTDQIIPARFLKATTRDGFGDNLLLIGVIIKMEVLKRFYFK